MKYTVHVTVVYSVDVDPERLGLRNRKEILEHAKGVYSLLGNEFDVKAEIFEKYDDEPKPKKVKKGVGSY